MKYKSIATPAPSVGHRFTSKKAVVPNMSMSLEEILRRFTRGEKLPIGNDGNFDDGDDDLEKISHMDLVDREEFTEKLRQTRKAWEHQEREKQKAEKARLDKMAVEKIAAEKIAAEKAAGNAK